MGKLAKQAPTMLSVERAQGLLAQCAAVDEAKDIRDKAIAIQTYQRSKGASAEAAADCAEIVAMADFRIGELLLETEKAPGGGDQRSDHRCQEGTSDPGAPPTLTALLGMAPGKKDAAKKLSSKTQGLARKSDKERKEYVSKQREKAAAVVSGHRETHVAKNSGENEWYTPPLIIGAAQRVLGKIDLDPASSETANKCVGATKIFTAENSGLEQPWAGRVWMNPPYANPLIGQFCTRLLEHVGSGAVTEAIVLVNNATETAWGQSLLVKCSAVCFPSSRVKFLTSGGEKGAPLQGQMIVYLGSRSDAFRAEFAVFGVVR